jgi:hypothetical protein
MAALWLWLRQNQICFFLMLSPTLLPWGSQAAALPAVTAAPALCQAFAADTPPLTVQTANGNQLQQQFANHQGVLRWWSVDDLTAGGQFDLLPGHPQAAAVAAEPATAALSWLSLRHASKSALTGTDDAKVQQIVTPDRQPMTGHSAPVTAPDAGLLLAWFDPRSQRQQVALVKDQAEPELLWQSQAYPPLAAGEALPAAPALYYYRRQQQLIPVALHHADPASRSQLQLQDARTGEVLVNWPLATTAATDQLLHLQRLVAAPAALDKNLDGGIDRIYLLDQSGQLVRLELATESSQAKVELVADLSGSGWQFIFNLQVSRAMLATAWLPPALAADMAGAASAEGSSLSSNKTQLNNSLQQAGDVLVLLAKRQEQYKLLVLQLPDQRPAGLIRWQDLVTVASQPPQGGTVAPQASTAQTSLVSGYGWWTNLPAAPIRLPTILAGVIYQPLAPPTPDCQTPKLATQMLALHLYQGSAVYPQALWSLAAPTPAWLELVLLPDERLGLAGVANGPVLLEGVRGITAGCPRCSELLSIQQFPIWQRLSSYQHEQGAY